MDAAGDGVDPEGREDGEEAEGEQPEQLPAEYDIPRGRVGYIYEDVFKDLYAEPPPEETALPAEEEPDAAEAEAAPPAEGGSEAGTQGGDGGGGRTARPWEQIDLTREDEEIEAIKQELEANHNRIANASSYLQEKWEHASGLDREHTERMQKQGLVVREQIPVPDSTLRHVISHDALHQENLSIPRNMMSAVERHIAIKTGVLAEHDNLLAVSKPDAPNYLKTNSSHTNRMTQRNIQPRLTDAQRTLMSTDLEQRNRARPPMPKVLNAEQRMQNLAVIKRMQTKVNFLKNPRFIADAKSAERGETCPFRITPTSVTFRNYEVGGVYEVQVELRNATGIGRHVSIVPCKNEVFSHTPLVYDGVGTSSVVAPGMAARFAARFAPSTLNDQTDQLLIRTELGDYTLPVLSRRVQPQLDFEEPVNIGCILAGQFATRTVTISNLGGEGSFRLVPAEDFDPADDVEHQYETAHDTGVTTFVSPNFRVEPATFYLESDQSVELTIHFSATSTGQFTYPLQIEGDNGERVPLTLLAISDAVRLELQSWPTLQSPVAPRSLALRESPWSAVPWMMNWNQPGAQVGCSESQAIELSNGGYLPVKVHWRLVTPPSALLSNLAVAGPQRLSDRILKDMHTWPAYDPAKHGMETCPFTVSPISATIPPFSKATFTFAFYAYAPVNHCSTVCAYLAATELPASKHCLLHYEQLSQMQQTMQPPNYRKGLPLFGGAVSELVDTEASSDEPKSPSRLTSTCIVTAVCLRGRSTAPKVTCLPPLVALSGDVLPYVSHVREVVLRNVGPMPAFFRFRLTSRMPSIDADTYDPMWIVAPHEVSARPSRHQEDHPTDPAGQLQSAADRLANEWPPLPPYGGHDAMLPGFGALATVAIEPHQGRIPPGGVVKICVTLRVAQECDLDTHLLVDLPTSLDEKADSVVPPIKVRVLAAARAPRVEIRGTPFLDYGVVRAHARHVAKLRLENPSDMPTVVRLRHRPEGKTVERGAAVAKESAPEGPPTARSALGDATPRVGATPRTSNVAREEVGQADQEQVEEPTVFPVGSHQDVVDLFLNHVRSGSNRGALPMLDTQEVVVEPWVHARSGCLDQSGRRKHQFRGRGHQNVPDDIPEDDVLGVADDVDFIFQPECVALWPHQSTEVNVTLRTNLVEKYNALVEVAAFDSGYNQCIGACAEVQLPRLRLSTQHAHFPVTYVKTASEPFELELFNDYDMPATFQWNIPVKLEACIECQIEPLRGVVPPRSSIKLKLIAVPTREADYANLLCQVFVVDIMQPLALQVSAKVYGPEVDYAVVDADAEPPIIELLPRQPYDEPCGTYQVATGQAPLDQPNFDFGELELLKTKTMQLVLYNRTGIPTPFGIQVDKNPAWDPLSKGKKIGSLLEAATRMYAMATTANVANNASATARPEDLGMQTFSTEPQPAAGGRQPSVDIDPSGKDLTKQVTLKKTTDPRAKSRNKFGSSRFDPKARRGADKASKSRRFLLDDKHEAQAFRNDTGAQFAKEKKLKEEGMVALKSGRGYAVSVEPSSDWLQPFSTAKITCTCYSDVPGVMEDDLIVTIGQLKSHAEGGNYRIPMRLLSRGNPLYLPDQQVGLKTDFEPPRLLIETITPAAKTTTRTFKIGNNAMTQVHLSWKVLSQLQVDEIERRRNPPEEPVAEEPVAREPSEAEDALAALQAELDSMDTEEIREKAAAMAIAEEDLEAAKDADDARAALIELIVKKKAADDAEAAAAAAADAGEDAVAGEPVAEGEAADPAATDAEAGDAAAVDGGEDAAEHADGDEAAPDGERAESAAGEEGAVGSERAAGSVAEAAEEVPGSHDGEAVEEVPRIEDPYALQSGEPPIRIEPAEAVLPVQGTATFTVTMTASKATTTSEGHYQYRLVGEGRYTEEREALLNAQAGGAEATMEPAAISEVVGSKTVRGAVADLPEIKLDDAELHDDDSDIEQIPSGRREADKTQKPDEARRGSGEGQGKREQDIISTIVIDCVGDCIIPRLTVDKKGDPSVEEFTDGDGRKAPVFKFVHSAVEMPPAAAGDKPRTTAGVKLGGAPGGTPHQGVSAGMVREVTMANDNTCHVYCRFRAEGPFRIQSIEQAGKKTVVPLVVAKTNKRLRPAADEQPVQDPMQQLFAVPARGTITLQVEFVPSMVPAAQWTHNIEHTFRGDVVVEYPRDELVPDSEVDVQRIHLLSKSRKPAISLNLIPYASLDPPIEQPRADLPPWAEQPPILIEFGYVHIDSAMARHRAILLSSETNVVARWRIFHVGRKRRPPLEIGVTVREDEDFRALDDREAFAFDLSEGELHGPSKDGLVPGSEIRMPSWCPTTPALPKRLPHIDAGRFEPQKVVITFKPKRNEVYKCRFRVQVEEGKNVDFICRGCGSYDEEDDAMDYQEA